MMAAAAAELRTARLLLRAPDPALRDAVCAYRRRNRAHFAPWDPPLPADHADPAQVTRELEQAAESFALGSAYRYWLLDPDTPGRVLGQAHVSQLARGAFQNAMLGYALDAQAQGRGLMHEALRAVIDEMFGPIVRLHRLQAAVRPENRRSRAVLGRLGFEAEGLSRRYLFINGAWRDHQIFALRHPGWRDDMPP